MECSSKDMLLLDPKDEIVFTGPLKDLNNVILTMTNPDDTRTVHFKIKTTAPKSYYVRPNAGQLKPKESVKVQIFLQSVKMEREKHKFLVQAAYGPEKEDFDPHFWQGLDINKVWNVKLRSIINYPDGTSGDLHKYLADAGEDVSDESVKEGRPPTLADKPDGNDMKLKDDEPQGQVEAKQKQAKKTDPGLFFYMVAFFMLVAALFCGIYYNISK